MNLKDYQLERFARLAAHWEKMSGLYPAGDIRGPIQLQFAKELREILEITEVPAGRRTRELIDWCNQEGHSIKGLLCSAFEGGSNYWYFIDNEKTEFAAGITFDDFREGGKQQDPNDYWHWCQLIPMTPGCALWIGDKDDDEAELRKLDLDAIERGLQLLRDKHPRHWADFVTGNDDADTGDTFLQLCLFGEVVFC